MTTPQRTRTHRTPTHGTSGPPSLGWLFAAVAIAGIGLGIMGGSVIDSLDNDITGSVAPGALCPAP